MEYVYPLVIGILAGWVASTVLGGKGGLLRNAILGLIGAYVGALLLPKLGVTLTDNADLNNLIVASGGAVLVLLVIQMLGK